MKITGIHPANGQKIEVTFSRNIDRVEPLTGGSDEQTYLAPAWIDIQVNGFAGVDYNSPETSHEAIARSIHAQFAAGVARLLPTVVTGSRERTLGCLRNLARARSTLAEGAAIEGFHVEGPYISSVEGPLGAHPREFVRPPDLDEFLAFQEAAEGHILLMTLAPELPGALRFIEKVTAMGVKVSIGHSNATIEDIQNAVSAGASLSTHLGNASLRIMPRHPNIMWEQMAEDRLMASFIVDGFHLPLSFLRTGWRAKGASRFILITDASTPAACPPGTYHLGALEVELHNDGSIRLAGSSRLAGSALALCDAISNLMRDAGVSLSDAIDASTKNPATALNLPNRQKGLGVGERADFVRFTLRDGRISILETYLDGQQVFHK